MRHVEQPGAGGRTRRRISHWCSLSQAELEGLEQRYPEIEEILPLSPLQEGLVFHALYDEEAPDVYTVQLTLSLAGWLEADLLRGGVASAAGAPCEPAGGVCVSRVWRARCR